MHVLVSLLNIYGGLFEQADSLFEDLNKIGEIVVDLWLFPYAILVY